MFSFKETDLLQQLLTYGEKILQICRKSREILLQMEVKMNSHFHKFNCKQ